MTNNLEDLAYRFRWQIAFLLVGISLAAGGVFLALNSQAPSSKVEIITDETSNNKSNLRIEVSGGVNSPGVYELSSGSRIQDALTKAGDLSLEADTKWIDKYLNRAAFLTDGQKIYIPTENDQTEQGSANNLVGDESISNVLASENEELISINTSSQSELETLSGIGPVYAKKVIENRPYSSMEELESKSIIPKSTFEKIKDKISVY